MNKLIYISILLSALWAQAQETVGCFERMPGKLVRPAEGSSAFAQEIAPVAVELQEYTGWPASVIIAMAALETKWGKWDIGVHNYYGHQCSNGITYEVPSPSGSLSVTVRGCTSKIEAARWSSFDSFTDSAIAYVGNVLFFPGTEGPYRKVRERLREHLVASLRDHLPADASGWSLTEVLAHAQQKRLLIPVLDYNEALKTLVGNYEGHNADKTKYSRTLNSIVETFGLAVYDRAHLCQK